MTGRTSYRSLSDKLDSIDPDGSKRARARERLDAEIAEHERSLAELRKALKLTQDQLARQLEVTQPQVSRIERQTDLYLSTLRSYLEAMGFELEVAAVQGSRRVVLSFDDLTPAASRTDATSEQSGSLAQA